jgi:predicted CopG family antitoxin
MERIISVSIETGNKLKELKKQMCVKKISDVIDKLLEHYETNNKTQTQTEV